MTVVVQVNGKLRDRLEVAAGRRPTTSCWRAARALPRVAAAIDGRRGGARGRGPRPAGEPGGGVGGSQGDVRRDWPFARVTARRASRAPGARSVRPMDRLLPWLRRSGWAYVAAALALAAGGVARWGRAPAAGEGSPPRRRASTAGSLVTAPAAPPRPGPRGRRGPASRASIRIAAGARVIQAIRRAGGPTRRADLSALNLAAIAAGRPAGAGPGAGAERGAAAGARRGRARRPGPLSLSSATAEDLEALDGIGPTLAARIVEWRTAHGGFASVDQLLDVPGIGPARLDALRADVVP